MADKKPTVITVKDATLVAMTQSCSGNAQGARKVANTAGKAWAITVLWLNAQKDLKSFDHTKDVKDIAKDLRDAFANAFLTEWDEAVTEGHKEELTPESIGKNARTGKMMEILDSDGIPKFSSWEETQLSIQYCSNIATVVKAELIDELILGKGKVLGKSDILAKAKVPETPLKTIKRSAEMIETKATAVAAKDLAEAIQAAEAALKALKDIQDGKAVATDAEADSVAVAA